MKTTLGKAISLGLGLAIAGKEQIEKTVEELVQKGEVSRAESKALIHSLIEKGSEAQQQIEALVREKVQAILSEQGLATAEEVARLKERVEALEKQQAQ